VILAIIWTPVIVDWVGRKFGSLFDGGDAEIEPKPLYSIFHAQQSQGKYYVALAEIRRQLDKFPTDFEGLMLLAELQAQNLNDLPGAEVTIHRLCGGGNHTPNHVAYALNQLADWHLSLTKDRDGAQKALEKILELLPETEMSLQAAQRIARLADTESLLAPQSRQRVTLKKGVAFLGLEQARDRSKPAEADPAKEAAEYVKHLERHPLDTLARENLAVLYATHFHRLDLALDQLEQLVRQPNQPAKQVVHWLNLMADLQVKEGDAFERIRETLGRIIDQYPDLAATENTRRRLSLLKLELKGKEPAQAVQLGIYEQDLGLKRSASDKL
jgi:tetratricopeptide (TPR) repeat protein